MKNFSATIFALLTFFALEPASLGSEIRPFSESTDLDQLKTISPQKLIQAFTAKCLISPHRVRPDCFLTERDISDSGDSDQVLLFRGESHLFSIPATSSFYRWAVGTIGFCYKPCGFDQLSDDLFSSIHQLWDPSESSLFFRKEDLSWRDSLGTQAEQRPRGSNDLTPLELVMKAHLRENHFLSFENSKESGAFDPFVSFTTNPSVAAEYAIGHGDQSKSEGAVWMAKIPLSKTQLLKKEECRNLKFETTDVYDFRNCVPLSNDFEYEFDVFMYLPSQWMYSRFIGPDVVSLDNENLNH